MDRFERMVLGAVHLMPGRWVVQGSGVPGVMVGGGNGVIG